MAYAPFKDSPDNVYLNIRINHDPSYGVNISPATYDVTKPQPIINNCNDYFCSIIEATVPLDTIPLWVAFMEPNQANPLKMTSVIAVRAGPFYFSENLIFIPQINESPPVQDQPYSIITYYHFAYSYQSYLNSLNAALATAFVAAGSPGGGNAPYFYLDSSIQLLVLVVGKDFSGDDGFGNPVNFIEINNYALNYLNAFNYFYDSKSPTPIRFVLDDIGNICNEFAANQGINAVAPNASDYRYYYQQYYALEGWNPLRKIAITTTTIPTYNEYLSIHDKNGAQTQQVTNFPVILDFAPNITTGAESRSVAFYRPTAEYRMVDLIAGSPLYKIGIKVYWVDRLGNLFPLELQTYQSVDIKFAFIKKNSPKQ